MEPEQAEVTKVIAKFIVESDSADIPSSVYEHAKIAFQDWLAVTMAGKDEALVLKLLKLSDLMGGNEHATVLGHGVMKNVGMVTLINGAASHALDYDDTMSFFMGHPSVTLFPSLLAISEWQEKSGFDFLTAYIIGLQVGACIGKCTTWEHYTSGWHATSTIGRLASAAGCARLMGLDEQQTVHALGIAGTQASGFKRVFGTMCKPFHAGRASQIGLEAALLAAEGFTSVEDILEGPTGFFKLLKGNGSKRALSLLDKAWDTESLVQKYHASCHFTHSAIEALKTIATEHSIESQDVRSIRAFVSQLAVDATGNQNPRTGLEGKFSMPYALANSFLRGDTGLQAFSDERVHDPEVREFMKKIDVVVDPKMSKLGSRITLKTESGELYDESFDVFKEIPELKIKKIKIEEKYNILCSPVLGTKKKDDLMRLLISLEQLGNMKELIAHARP